MEKIMVPSHDNRFNPIAYTTADPGDLTVIGNETPRYCYGINLGFNWNGIGISTFWQGVGKKDWYPRYDSAFLAVIFEGSPCRIHMFYALSGHVSLAPSYKSEIVKEV
jgi:hypothetical protein